MNDKHLVYIHGFLSSPLSKKAELTRLWLERYRPDISFYCPQLSSYPDLARDELSALFSRLDQAVAIGSSLGGFWASHFIEAGKIKKAVLVNPAVAPHTRFQHYLGQSLKSYYSDDHYVLEQKHLDVLAACESRALADSSRYWLMQQKGDEVLDWTMAQKRYAQCRSLIEDGGCHSFDGYEKHLPQIIDFLFESRP
ncbi:YqiA/YcfP family alpha/beta fold hydrolase [Agaribacterium haliotis]|uniref:YqiA/YcfP family alpha/beta fold hydrolase n=1 Tax=Agaribacterium haliotis TaxID=2013869 RepID=UPI000BB5391D|nr:YqiA/YcfP family alpha/beta fold hydrolase [Agaribacterium haliotis]